MAFHETRRIIGVHSYYVLLSHPNLLPVYMTLKLYSECMAESSFDPQSLVRRFTGLGSVQRKNTYESPDDVRGPLGLRVQYDPKDPFVEFVFVHSFPGGSRKTWSHNDEIATFWPKEWLPHENGFSHVRVHTFGYDADWLDRRADIGKINHFGKLLLDSIASNAYFRKNDPNPIVFIAHSLGGLVVKKAINDAKQSHKYHDLAQRFHTLCFLATPHQGLDNETMVLNILKACSLDSRSHHVSELEPNFAIVEDINQNFRHTFHGIRIYCFYETRPSFPGARNVVVDRNAATLGFADQDPIPLMADHRGVSRFGESSDSDYQLIRDTLATTVEEISGEFLHPEKIQNQMRLLGDYLGVFDNEEEEMSTLVEVRGSCEWLLQKPSFTRWRDTIETGERSDRDLAFRFKGLSTSASIGRNTHEVPRIFWLPGPPGSGKSHLSAYVIRHLESYGACSYYFLKHTDRSKQSLGGLLRSLALQMANRNVALRRALLSMQQDDSLTAEVNDIRAIWKQLFVQRIFRMGFQKTQYWLIDALDEGIGGQELIKLFERIPTNLPLKIFITSRYDAHMERLLRALPTVTEPISVANTLGDIHLFLEANRECLHVNAADVEALIDELLDKSQGSFLWVRLILQRLDNVWNRKAITKVMQEVPDDMNALYSRILEEMEGKPNKDLAKAILRWTICAGRSLTTTELQEAIQRDIDDSIPIIEKMIGDVCGQLIVIEAQGKVRLVHDTARDFLLNHTLTSEFAVNKMAAHGRVAEICLQYLIEGDVRQIPRRAGQGSGTASISALHEYAHLYFSEHVVKGPPADTDAIDRVAEFLDSRVLHWVEYIARQQNLDCLTQTAKNLDAWVDCRSDHSLLTRAMKFVRGWAADLIRLATVFGKHILSDPSCIHNVIPPLCPTGSEIYRRFGSSSPAMEVVGISDKGWADRIFSAPFHDDSTTSTACSEAWYAAGLKSGMVVLYNASTCQEGPRLNHKAAIKHLEFSTLNEWILVSGSRKLSLWNYTSGDPIWSVDTTSEAMALGFFEEDSIIVAATRSNHIVTHAISDGSVLGQVSWQTTERAKPPMRVFMSVELNLVAAVYRHERVWLLDLANLTRPRYFGGQATVSALAFNPAFKMMAVGFLDGELCIVNLSTLNRGPTISVNAGHLAVSGDGKTLVVGGTNGNITIHDFEQLTELYTVRLEDEDIMSLAFSPNGLQIVDVRRKQFNIWEPSALYRRKDNDDSGSQGRTSYGTAVTQQYPNYSTTDAALINAIASHHSGEYIFCGRADGSVCVYNTSNGRYMGPLFTHGPIDVIFVEWNGKQEVLITCDTSDMIMAHKAQLSQVRTPSGVRLVWQVSLLFSRRIEAPVLQILSSVDGEYLLVSDLFVDHLWTLKGEDILKHRSEHPDPTRTLSQKWAIHPRYGRRLYQIDSHGVHTLKWQRHSTSLPKQELIEVRSIDRIDFETRDNGVHLLKFGESMWAAYDDNPLTRPIIWEAASSSESGGATEAALERFNLVAPEMQYLLAMYRSHLVFLNHDGWICSVRIEDQGLDRLHARHFPVPHCWRSLTRRMIGTVTPKGDVVIAKNDELAIVKRGYSVYLGINDKQFAVETPGDYAFTAQSLHTSNHLMGESSQLASVRASSSSTNSTTLNHRDYTVGLICAISPERVAAEGMLDALHEPPPLQQVPYDRNNYTFGKIGVHNVVIACLPDGVTGTISAAWVASWMLSSFEGMELRLLMGIAGGVPSKNTDIRLGDVVVSKPTATFGGVIQYDLGKTVEGNQFLRTGMLNRPPDVLLNAVSGLQAKHIREGDRLSEHLTDMMDRYPRVIDNYSHPGTEHDSLYDAEYDHITGHVECGECDAGKLVNRAPRRSEDPEIHYGLIATGNLVMRHGATRDRLGRELGVLCFEMEAAGLMNNFPCLVIRGICDYADSHKNKRWQGYAAATAAAYVRELLLYIPGQNAGSRTATALESPEGSAPPNSIKQHKSLSATFKSMISGTGSKFIAAAVGGDVFTLRELLADEGHRFRLNRKTINRALIAVSSSEKRKEEHVETVRLLLSQDAALEHRDDEYRRTPLIWAAIFAREDIIDVLLDNQALIDGKDEKWDWTALMWAIWWGRDAIVQQLSDRGASLEATDRRRGRTPLLWAVRSKRHAAVEILLRKNRELIELKDKKKLTPLALAYMEGDGTGAELLIEYGADPNFTFESGLPLLMSAVIAGKEDFVYLLVEKGADIVCRNKNNEPALSVAVKEGHAAIARFLIDKEAPLEAKDNQGRTALLWAVALAREDLVKLLVESGADRFATDNKRRTVGLWADWTKNREIIKLVSKKG
ncbi:hypothetical protein GJ744_003893 [Endocarpon pusillum]|uniref:DUF676 domain-containing protein n=1 Tax=Endocarpon pusillum TaxID=364733 RepID=A0A8H7DZI9_9EURO|nr:hypothetical protein GJ744_003893 [Endocarpon pusillum]